jgi:hypothetical protein
MTAGQLKRTTSFLIMTVALSLIVASAANSAENPLVRPDYLERLKGQTSFLSQLPIKPPSNQCARKYDQIWSQKKLRIDWIYGYIGHEWGTTVWDPMLMQTSAEALTQPCQPGLFACGFSKTSDQSVKGGALVLEKDLSTDGHSIEIRMWDSSLDGDNTVGFAGIHIATPKQRKRSEFMWRRFLRSFNTAQILIYDGHSDFGHGPAFGPSGLVQDAAGFVIEPNLNRFIKAIQSLNGPKPEVFAVASCYSDRYYREKFHALLPSTSLVTTKGSQKYISGEQSVLGFIDSLLARRCSEDMNTAMIPFMPSNGADDAEMKIHYFDEASVDSK